MSKKYFTLFGILIATVKEKIKSTKSMFQAILLEKIPKISMLLHKKVLKPKIVYSTNKVY